MNKTNISAGRMLPLLRARRGVLDAISETVIWHVDQSVDSKFPSGRRHSTIASR